MTEDSKPWNRFLFEALLEPSTLLRNVEVTVVSLDAHQPVPLVLNRRGSGTCSWVTSLRNSYGPYARAETDLVKMNRWIQPLYLAGSYAAEALLAAGGLAGGSFLNNWLLATNLYPHDFDATNVLNFTPEICRRAPELPVVIRSLTPQLHQEILHALAQAGFLLLPTRQVWIVNNPSSGDWRRHRDAKRDLALAVESAGRWMWVEAAEFSSADYAAAHRHFQRLYRERYPKHNPDYTEDFIRKGVTTGFLEVHGLRPAGGGPLVGFIGMAHRGNLSCTPLLGYDLDAPVEWGLYRLLMLKAFQTCEVRRSVFHCSAGAGLFKYNRGAVASVEFAAVWANHLPLYRRANLRALSAAVMKWAVPYLESHKL